MELSQFKIRSFVIGLIVLGVIITLASWGISRIYNTYNTAPTPTVVNVTNATPTTQANRGSSLQTPPARQNRLQTTASITQPTPTPQPNRKLASQPKTGPDDIEVSHPGITVTTPADDQQAGYPMQVKGLGNVTSQQITLEILDQNGYILGSTQVNVCYGLEACPFETAVNYSTPGTETGYLYAYTINSLGEKTYETLIPLTF